MIPIPGKKCKGSSASDPPSGRRRGVLVLALALAFLCTGCMSANVEELYSLPQMSEEYVQLQALIDQTIDNGGSYAAPTGGSNRQTIQLRDLDGDGIPEALAFLTDADHIPMVCVYRQDEHGDYYHSIVLPGNGTSVAGVDYADLDGDGASELILVWQGGGSLKMLCVYSLGSSEQSEQECLLSADCSEFVVCDLDGDGVADLLDLQMDVNGGKLVMYRLGDGQTTAAEAALSDGVSAVRRAVAGSLADGAAALFVESDLGGGEMVTDVFTADNGQLRNITMSADGRSDTLRPAGLYAADIDGDLALEIPTGHDDLLTWYSLTSDGSRTADASSYYDTVGGWYFVLPASMADGVFTEEHGAGGHERAIVFSVSGGMTPQRNVLVIYALTGDNRLDRAAVDGRFILRQEERVIYAAQLLTDELTEKDIRDNFYIIYDQWQAGDL